MIRPGKRPEVARRVLFKADRNGPRRHAMHEEAGGDRQIRAIEGTADTTADEAARPIRAEDPRDVS